MRKEHHQPSHAQPFGLTRCDELVNDHLCSIGKVAELSFPEDECMRLSLRVSILKPQNAELRQGAIDNFNRCLAVSDVRQWDVFVFVLLVDENGMTM